MKKLIILLLILSGCVKESYIPVQIEGTYYNDDLTIIFEYGNIIGNSKCNDLYGTYEVNNDSISISIGGTKIGCENDFKREYLNGKYNYYLNEKSLKIYGSDYIIELYPKI
jgi:hypothetical protein